MKTSQARQWVLFVVEIICCSVIVIEICKVRPLWNHFDKYGLARSFLFDGSFGKAQPWAALLLDLRHVQYALLSGLFASLVIIVLQLRRNRFVIAVILCATTACSTVLVVLVVEMGTRAFIDMAPPVTEYIGSGNAEALKR